MENDVISTADNIASLRQDLAKHYNNPRFLHCQNMGQMLRESLEMVKKKAGG
jgi:hypothetical protein